jgi:hypothetical protein
MPSWKYNPDRKRYIAESGKQLTPSQVRGLAQRFIDSQKAQIDGLTSRLVAREITLQQWEREVRDRIKLSFVDQYALGVGGRNNMGFVDFGRCGALIKEQYQYLHLMAQDIAAGRLSETQVRHKSGNYLESSMRSYERGFAASYGLELPTYPRDGSQTCHYNCRCHWRIEETASEYKAYWIMKAGDNCSVCSANSTAYNPYTVEKPRSKAA